MPIAVNDYIWRQTENVVVIRVPLKGVHSSNVDIFSYDTYVKAHYQQYIFEVFLFSPVNESKSECTISENEIVFELHKMKNVAWEKLEADLSKEEKQEMRRKVIERVQELAEAETKKKKERKAELDRLAVRQQISLDTEHHKKIEEIKGNEKKVAMKELEEWKISQLAKEKDEAKKEKSSNEKTAVVLPDDGNMFERVENKEEKDEPVKYFDDIAAEYQFDDCDDGTVVLPMPLPRNQGIIPVRFTPRDFPTPKRESQAQEEEEWLKKLVEARKSIGFVAEDLSPEELDPVWLKEKGNSFFKAGNYLGAISAFSHGIKLGIKMPALYSNRAAAHLAIGNLNKCVEDCSTALDLLTPKISANALSRARCHARRGTALCKMGLFPQGMGELEAAIRLQPDNDKLRMDLEKARAMVEASVTTDDLD